MKREAKEYLHKCMERYKFALSLKGSRAFSENGLALAKSNLVHAASVIRTIFQDSLQREFVTQGTLSLGPDDTEIASKAAGKI